MCVLGPRKNGLIETGFFLSTHNICFGLEISKLISVTHSSLEACKRAEKLTKRAQISSGTLDFVVAVLTIPPKHCFITSANI